MFADRHAVWTGRLTHPASTSFTIVAEANGCIGGFAHTILDADPNLGALLENLHVSHELKGRGIGRMLMSESARELRAWRAASGLYLTVLEQNSAAQAFYDARGGVRVGRRTGGPFPGGGMAPVFVYAWPDPSVLLGDSGAD